MQATIASSPLHELVRVDHVDAPHVTRRRLAELGVRPGARVEVMSVTAGGGRVLAVSGSRIALDRATAAGIAVIGDDDGQVAR